MSKKVFLLLGVIAAVTIYWFSREVKKVETEKIVVTPNSDSLPKMKKVMLSKKSVKSKIVNNKVVKKPGLETGELLELISNTRKEIRDCEITLTDILGDEEDPVNLESLDESQLLSVLDDFDQAQINVLSLGSLLEGLANSEYDEEEDEMISEELSEVRPCRPFQKISFVHFLIKRFQNGEENELLRGRIKKSLFLFFNKELEYVRSMSSVNMIANIYATLVEEKVISDIGDVKASDFIDELEDSYDKLIDLAEDSLDDSGNERGSKNLILKEELMISNNYRNKLQRLIQLQQNE